MPIEFNEVARRVGLCFAVIPFAVVDAVYSAITISAKIGIRVRDEVGNGIVYHAPADRHLASLPIVQIMHQAKIAFAEALGWGACALTTLLSAVVIAACSIPNMCINFYSAVADAQILTMRARANDCYHEQDESNLLYGIYTRYADLKINFWRFDHLISTKADPYCAEPAVAMI